MAFSWPHFSRELVSRLDADMLADIRYRTDPEGNMDADRCNVLIGIGGTREIAGGDLVLNNKAWKTATGGTYGSVACLVRDWPDSISSNARISEVRSQNDAIDACLARLHLRVEDASPDSILAFILFLARMAGAETPDLPLAWIKAADNWERTGNAGDPYRNWAPLCSALAHSYFSMLKPSSDTGGTDALESSAFRENLRQAWISCLRMTVEAIGAGCSPDSIPDEIQDVASARAAIQAEEQSYAWMLTHAQKLQLNIPMAGSLSRKMLVDALFFSEDDPAGVKKLFIRQDTKNSPLGKGFSFFGVYRSAPSLVGSGDDITFSTDVSRGLTLADFWLRLEEMEEIAWSKAGEVRPHDEPRSLSHPAATGRAMPNQPWYLDPTGTFIAAPRKVVVNGKPIPGKKVSWTQACDALWSLYNPAHDIRVLDAADGLRRKPLLDCVPVRPTEEGAKRLFLTRYAPPDESALADLEPPSIILSRTVQQIVAAMVDGRESGQQIGYADLPAPSSFEEIPLPGGHAVVTRKGCFLFDDWGSQELPDDQLCEQFDLAVALCQKITNAKARLDALSEQAHEFVGTRRGSSGTKLLAKVSQLRIELASMRVRLATLPADPAVRIFRARLDHWWGLERTVDDLQAQAQDIESAVHSLDEARQQRFLSFFAKWGTPIFIGAALADPLQKAFGKLLLPQVFRPAPPVHPESIPDVILLGLRGIGLLPPPARDSWTTSDLSALLFWGLSTLTVVTCTAILWWMFDAWRSDR